MPPEPSEERHRTEPPSDGRSGGNSPAIRTPTRRRRAFRRTLGTQDRIADAITRFSGSMTFVYLHVAWFAAWVLINAGVFGRALIFDPFPYGLLTMVVSLEAIFLSTFVLISQNRSSQHDEYREEEDFRTNVRSEIWLRHIGESLGIQQSKIDEEESEKLARIKDSEDGGGS